MSKIIESLRGDLAALREAGAISKVTMREFDAICPPPVREFSATDIKRLRETLELQLTAWRRCCWRRDRPWLASRCEASCPAPTTCQR